MADERTLVLCKPDAVARGLVGEVVGRLERKGFRLVAMELRTLDEGPAKRHYAEHEGKPFYEPLLEFMSSGPVTAADSRAWPCLAADSASRTAAGTSPLST